MITHAAMNWASRRTASAGDEHALSGPDQFDRIAAALGPAGLAIVAALAGALAVGVVLFIRERRHRRQVNQLFVHLRELEELCSPVEGADEPAPLAAFESQPAHNMPQRPTSIRGWLSSAISSLRRRSAVESSEPSSIDLRAIRFLYSCLEQQVTPAELAARLHVSLRTLQRHITTKLGCSPRDLIVAVKMHEAKRLLSSGGLQVREAAKAVGFEDAYYFSRRFRAYYGVPPSKVKDAA